VGADNLILWCGEGDSNPQEIAPARLKVKHVFSWVFVGIQSVDSIEDDYRQLAQMKRKRIEEKLGWLKTNCADAEGEASRNPHGAVVIDWPSGAQRLNTTLNTTRGVRKISPVNSVNLMEENEEGKRYRLYLQSKAILGSWHSTTELLPLAYLLRVSQNQSIHSNIDFRESGKAYAERHQAFAFCSNRGADYRHLVGMRHLLEEPRMNISGMHNCV